MNAQALKERMLEELEFARRGDSEYVLSATDLFVIEHFVRSFPTGKEVRKNEDTNTTPVVVHVYDVADDRS